MKHYVGLFAAIALALFAAGCGAPEGGSGGSDGGGGGGDGSAADGGMCATCDDHLFCNGAETCTGGHCSAGTSPCLTGQTCDEAADRCVTDCGAAADADHDGSAAISCGGDDCDDSNAAAHPGATEVCDAMGVDEDCDPSTIGTRDGDSDGHTDRTCCNGLRCGDDCDDMHADVYAGASETCNRRDDDCDGATDEALATLSYYPDCDNDGYGGALVTDACAMPTSAPGCAGGTWVTTSGDCDDARPNAHPGALEHCNGIDDDCNGTADDAAAVDPECAAANPFAMHASPVCMDGACQLGACATGYANCDGLVATGCEVDLTTDLAHCGTCTTACGAASTCASSACAPLVDVDAGGSHTCARYSTGRLVCWGNNSNGQLGDGTRTTRRHAVSVAFELTAEMIDAGGLRDENEHGINDIGHTCAADANGIYCWGRGTEGQLGNGLTASSNYPVVVATLPVTSVFDSSRGFVDIAVGGSLSGAAEIQTRPPSPPTWTSWAWGDAGASPAWPSSPMQIAGTREIDSIAAGPHHICMACGNDGGTYCLGSNGFGELGSASGPTSTYVRATAIPSSFWTSQVEANGIRGADVTPGGWRRTSGALTCARGDSGSFTAGEVYCFGTNSEGQLGNGGTPGRVSGLTDARDIAVGGRHACALRATGQVVCWGHNLYGQLGNGTSTDSNVPVVVSGITTAVAVAAGGEHSCAVLMDGTAWCWGRNDVGQLGNDSTGDSNVPVQVHGT